MLLDDPFAAGDSLIAESSQESAVGVLEECPVPVIAVADDGAVLFANTAFAHLLGHSCEALTAISYRDICSALPADETLFAVTRLGAKAIESLMQSGQATVFIKIRKSATLSGVDSDAGAMFKELMERLSN
jgi:nitrogen-specific signal transduction histidine kinase